jgi:NADH:ubiquinone oxidoreductase subunit 6 (subunit J)
MNPVHSVLLLATGVLAVLTLWQAAWRRRFAATQTIGYMLLYVFGLAFAANTPTATMWNLNTADHVLHGTLFVLGLTFVLMLYSGSLEPPAADDQVMDRPAEQSRAGAEQVGR